MATFARDVMAFWRNPKDLFLKIMVCLGLMLHISFFISLDTGWWDRYFHDSQDETTQAIDFFAV